ncbi:MAG: COG4223 family protein [Amphiplicatus sp.]
MSETESEPEKPNAAEPVEAEILDAEFTEKPGSPPPRPERPRLFGVTSPFSPGLTLFAGFAGLVALVLIAFFLWRGAQAVDARPAAQEAKKNAAAIEAKQAPPAAPAAPAVEETRPLSPPDRGKIANAVPADAKTAAADLPPAGADEAPASAAGLPPPPPGAANAAMQRSAKEALRALRPDAGDAIDLGSTPPPKVEFDVDGKAPETGSESRSAASEAQRAEIAALRESFERAIAAREARANQEIAELRARVESLQNEAQNRAAYGPAAAIAFADMQRAATKGAPYADELDRLARLAPGAGALDRLRKNAAIGAPTLAALKERFDPAARAALAAAAREKATGWFSQLLARFHQLVSVRPAGPRAGSAPAAIISRAEAALSRDDLDGAIGEIASLDGAAAAEFASWLQDARARAEIDEALAAESQRLRTELQN